jgi:uncharacterized small protein (TIGR04563 family)
MLIGARAHDAEAEVPRCTTKCYPAKGSRSHSSFARELEYLAVPFLTAPPVGYNMPPGRHSGELSHMCFSQKHLRIEWEYNQMANTDKRKQSLYFPEEMLKEIQDEANRQDRSLSWIVQQAWRIARSEIMRFPSVNDVLEAGQNKNND